MESPEQNKLLTEVGRGIPMGELMRRYWQPIGAAVELEDKWTQRVKLLGENLVLFRNRQSQLGRIAGQCPHRRASFLHGIPAEQGIRCPSGAACGFITTTVTGRVPSIWRLYCPIGRPEGISIVAGHVR